MIGFPNVGKSSCINALLGITATTHDKKRVAVGAQPGSFVGVCACVLVCMCAYLLAYARAFT